MIKVFCKSDSVCAVYYDSCIIKICDKLCDKLIKYIYLVLTVSGQLTNITHRTNRIDHSNIVQYTIHFENACKNTQCKYCIRISICCFVFHECSGLLRYLFTDLFTCNKNIERCFIWLCWYKLTVYAVLILGSLNYRS